MFLHGLDSSSQGRKARLLASLGVETPDFRGDLAARMAQLEPLLGSERWVLIGSSFGGLMAALWTLRHPARVHRLILLAPAFHRPDFVVERPVDVPTLLVHGTRDTVVPHELARARAGEAFSHLRVEWVDDDHRLEATARHLDWPALMGNRSCI
ncbi:MAG: alpha/beta fold hydrolase [Candidatus Eremiobacteraeota bacterium]|nr:alpha/beta fold hydrolase [Candidatus Eremiobacteraeota bacterium]